MCANRVEALESRIRELEASVEGLTDELVECKVRINELEETVCEDRSLGSSDTDTTTQFEAEVPTDDADDTAESAADGDDIIVA
jgi:chromosome segregation ATPase